MFHDGSHFILLENILTIGKRDVIAPLEMTVIQSKELCEHMLEEMDLANEIAGYRTQTFENQTLAVPTRIYNAFR